MLLVGRFMEETANFESNAVMKKYKAGIFIIQFQCETHTFVLFLKMDKIILKSRWKNTRIKIVKSPGQCSSVGLSLSHETKGH